MSSSAEYSYIPYFGVPIDTVETDIFPGWNMVGGPNTNIAVSTFDTISSLIFPIFEYNSYTGSYIETDTLRPFVGYWFLASDSTRIIMH